mgnify:CR=1 FL=1
MTSEERSRIDVVEAKVDEALVHLRYIRESTKDHETRLRSLERWKYALPLSAIAALGSVLGLILGR